MEICFAKDISNNFYTNKSISQVSGIKDLIDDVNIFNGKFELRGTDDSSLNSQNETKNLKLFSAPVDNFFSRNANSTVYIRTDSGQGTGIVISKDKIITNWHVIYGAEDNEVKVVFKPLTGNIPVPTQAHIAEVIRCDSNSDLALIKPRWPPKKIQPAKLADPTSFNETLISSQAHTIGHPGGGSTWSYASGTISQVIENKKWKYGPPFNSGHMADSIQIQTPINPGNSGGPLFNDNEEVIGVIVTGCQTCENIGNAIAISALHQFLDSNTNECIPLPPVKSEKKLIKENDRDKDGNIDIKYFDMTDSGKANWIHLDNTDPNDGWFETLLYDKDENGIYETQVYYPKYKGESVITYYDHDQDNIIDVCGIDNDADGKDDRQMPIDSCDITG